MPRCRTTVNQDEHLRGEGLDEADGVAVPPPPPSASPAPPSPEAAGLDAEVELIDGVLDLEGDLPGLAQPEQEQLACAAAALAVGPADECLQVGQLPAQRPDLGVHAQQRRRFLRRQLTQLGHHPRHPCVRHDRRLRRHRTRCGAGARLWSERLKT